MSDRPYNPKQIESEAQLFWKEHRVFDANEDSSLEKFYCLCMFPYPSGSGLHIGHPKGYIASDIYTRFKRMQGFNVLHPMGFDSFGLPAEQYAIEHNVHPAIVTEDNIEILVYPYLEFLESLWKGLIF